MLDGVQFNHHSQSTTAIPKPFANALKFGLGGHGHSQVPPSESKSCSKSPGSNPAGFFPVGQTTHSDPSLPSNPHPSHLDELLNCCLIGKIWGDPLPIPAIIHKTKKDWGFVEGQVEYIDAGNNWILLRFANAEDRLLVYDQRPWHVNGLNFVLQKWSPCFDSYIASITKIDQWVRVPRLHWEFWDYDSLAMLLQPVCGPYSYSRPKHPTLPQSQVCSGLSEHRCYTPSAW